MRATEDRVKSWLIQQGISVPQGSAAASPAVAVQIARGWSSGAVVKALIPTGRRGKAGAVRFCDGPEAVERAATDMIGSVVNGYTVKTVYVEKQVHLVRELYLSFLLENFPPQMLMCAEGGVDIEDVHAQQPSAILVNPIDPLKGVRPWNAIRHWERTSIDSRLLPALGRITTQLYDAFVAAGAAMLEINPLGIDREGKCWVVGAMMASEEPLSGDTGVEFETTIADRPLTALERRIIEANAKMPDGMMRFTELDGDIGMFVGGGGASLVHHDLVLAAGGRPANHMDASTTDPAKVRVLIDTILDNPRVRGLLVSWHYQQMAQVDRRVGPIIQALKDRKVDPRRFPIVVRMFGPGEEAARQAAADLPGVHYLPHGAPMEEGIRMIVDLTKRANRIAKAS